MSRPAKLITAVLATPLILAGSLLLAVRLGAIRPEQRITAAEYNRQHPRHPDPAVEALGSRCVGALHDQSLAATEFNIRLENGSEMPKALTDRLTLATIRVERFCR